MRRPLIIGVGQPWRGDDAAGLVAVERLRERGVDADLAEHHGEGLGLMQMWEDRPRVVLIDAAESGAAPGTLHRFTAGPDDGPGPMAARIFRTSSHAFGVYEAIETARVLGRLPKRLIVHAVEGVRWDLGAPLSPRVDAALPDLLTAVLADLAPQAYHPDVLGGGSRTAGA